MLSAHSTGPICHKGLVEHRIWDKLLKLAARGVKTKLLFVFAHCRTERNELVDLTADAAAPTFARPRMSNIMAEKDPRRGREFPFILA